MEISLEEKKAIEFLKENMLDYEEIDTSILLDINLTHKTILNLLEKLQKENELAKQEYDRDTHILQNQLDLANAKNIEKDKIIDLMAEEFKEKTLMYTDFTKEEIKQYFEKQSKRGAKWKTY